MCAKSIGIAYLAFELRSNRRGGMTVGAYRGIRQRWVCQLKHFLRYFGAG